MNDWRHITQQSNMDKINIENVNLSHLKQLQEIGRQTFSETFSGSNNAADMEKYLAEGFSAEKLAEELNNSHSQFYFAKSGETVIGYLKLNFGKSQTELQHNNAMEIERIYVLHQYQGKQVGQLLYKTAVQKAIHAGVDYIWLGVWEKNTSAIGFYKKNGFVEFGKHVFKLGNDEQTDIMMKLVL